MFIKNNKTKAILVTILFSVAGITAVLYFVNDWRISLPLILFYITLTFNTYFSVKLFSSITPEDDVVQNSIDIILGLLYIMLAFSVWNEARFVFIDLLMFIMATIKYAFMFEKTKYNKLFKKKVLVDLLGVTACAFTFWGIVSGYGYVSVWCLSIAFILANIILFTAWPLYRLES